MYNGWLAEGFARPGARHTPSTFQIASNCQVVVTDEVERTLAGMKPMLGFYVGGMGAKDMNFHKDVFVRMGYEKEADQIQDLFLEGRRDEAIATVPDQAVADISLVGSVAKIRDDLARWEDAGVTTLVVGAGSLDEMREVAQVILG
jgi:alkanesulfonate monooxygenase SsuD/methylene tetrahydromethanopterin reductase-like flavin-dependent oxidoreductase (luciferase family)